MANYITNTEDLTTVANAIRTKGGTSDNLVFPNGFAEAIANISGGGDVPEIFSEFVCGIITMASDTRALTIDVNFSMQPNFRMLRIADDYSAETGIVLGTTFGMSPGSTSLGDNLYYKDANGTWRSAGSNVSRSSTATQLKFSVDVGQLKAGHKYVWAAGIWKQVV